jgi:hypothetical protein
MNIQFVKFGLIRLGKYATGTIAKTYDEGI